MVIEASAAKSSVYPSGALFATLSVPMVPPAPVRFSTTTDWFQAFASSAAMMRP